MGRPPCCDKVGIKKGPWTPEEDIILVSYIQEHGPGNWRAVPTNTGLMRCSKSCRLRWTNYLRPGIKRGNFTPHEEGMIIHLQALLGNKWAAIATYLPQRTDNDIKNYWNTHLKKKLKKYQTGNLEPQMASNSTAYRHFMSRSYGERVTEDIGKPQSGLRVGENSSVYAASEENISRLLEGWMRSSPFQTNTAAAPPATTTTTTNSQFLSANCDKPHHKYGKVPAESGGTSAPVQGFRAHQIEHEVTNGISSSDHDLECIMSFDHHHSLMTSMANCEKSSCDSSQKGSESSGLMDHENVQFVQEHKPKMDSNPPLSFLEKWLLDESAGPVEGVMELPPIF